MVINRFYVTFLSSVPLALYSDLCFLVNRYCVVSGPLCSVDSEFILFVLLFSIIALSFYFTLLLLFSLYLLCFPTVCSVRSFATFFLPTFSFFLYLCFPLLCLYFSSIPFFYPFLSFYPLLHYHTPFITLNFLHISFTFFFLIVIS